ncbi:MAG: ATP-binding protein [Myxococcota bacterium]
MQVFRPEVHNLLIRPFMDDTRDALGEEALLDILEPFGVTQEELEDPNAWLSLEFVEAFFERLVALRNDPTLFSRCGRRVVSPKYFGFLRPLFRAFNSPMFTFTQVVKAGPRVNKIASMQVERTGTHALTLTYRSNPEAPRETTDHCCRARIANFSAVTTMFEMAPAVVHHSACMHRGDEACVYEIEWEEPRRRWRSALAFSLGGAFGLLLGFYGLGDLRWGALLGALGGLCAALSIRVLRLSGELREQIEDMEAQQDALVQSVSAGEARYEELLQAKAEVDEKVETRTAELALTGQRLSETLAEVRALDEAKTRFFTNVSHELRTPLSLILAPVDDLARGLEPPGGRQASLSAMQRNGKRLLHLINQLLDLSKFDAGEMKLMRRHIDIGDFVRGVVSAFESDAHRRDVTLKLEIADALTPAAVDPKWIESAITNLVANALKFSPPGSCITVRAYDRGGDVMISVEDQGEGMSDEDVAQVFSRFAQAEQGEKRGGTGLGLAIVREAARLHGGDVLCTSRIGAGTTFTLRIPRVVQTDDAETGLAARPSVRPVAAPTESYLPGAVRRDSTELIVGPSEDAPLALVVEDNDDLRRHVGNLLCTSYRVLLASDGEHGVRLAFQESPDVVISDVAMPRMDGYALCRALRADERTQGVPILLVTARSDVGWVLEGFEAGASDYVPKPFSARELLARVDVHVRLRSMLREMAVKERLATLGVLAASVAHQVRNPLTALVSGLPAMKKRIGPSVDPMTQEMMDVMMDCATRIERMTADLLDVSRIDREQSGPFSPGSGLLAAVRLVQARLTDGTRFDLAVDESTVLEGRAGDMNHVFLNLVDNAARAKPGGCVRIRGWATGADALTDTSNERGSSDAHMDEPAGYLVEVEDQGPGVPAAKRLKIFEPFYTTRPAGEGTGLGLAIAKQVIDRHGGTLRVIDSTEGGALFRVFIPNALRSPQVAAQ